MKRTMRNGCALLAAGVLLAACGGASTGAPSAAKTPATPTTTTSVLSTPAETATPVETATPATAHMAMPGEPALIQVAGYQYVDNSEMAAGASAMMKAYNSHIVKGFFTASSAHLAQLADGTLIAVVIELKVAPKYLGKSAAYAAKLMATNLVGPGATVATMTMSTEKVVRVTKVEGADTTVVYAWVHNGVVTHIVNVFDTGSSSDAAAAATFVTSYLTEAHR